MDLESLFGGSSRGAATRVPLTEERSSPLSGKVVLFNRAHSFGRDAHGAVREEGDTCLASQISQINPGDQWGDRCHSQIALTSETVNLSANNVREKRLQDLGRGEVFLDMTKHTTHNR